MCTNNPYLDLCIYKVIIIIILMIIIMTIKSSGMTVTEMPNLLTNILGSEDTAYNC